MAERALLIIDIQNDYFSGGKMELAMQLILTPMILKMMDVRRRALGAQPLRVTI